MCLHVSGAVVCLTHAEGHKQYRWLAKVQMSCMVFICFIRIVEACTMLLCLCAVAAGVVYDMAVSTPRCTDWQGGELWDVDIGVGYN